MAEVRQETHHHSGIHLSDILFALFKRKWTIILCAVVGIIAAAAFYFFYPPVYESQAKLLVRYVLERSAVDPIEAEKAAATSSNYTDKVIGAEIEILTSWDLAVQVAEAIGPKRLVPPATDLLTKVAHKIGLKQLSAAATEGEAAGGISSGLKVISNKGSNIILVSYKNHDPQMATLVLQELLSRYFIKHLEVHRSAGAFDFVTQQTDQVRARLNQTEDALKSLRDKTGIVSLKEGSEALTAEAAKTQEPLNAAEAELAEQKAVADQSGESKAKGWRIKGQSSEKSSSSEKLVLPASRQRSRRLRPGFAIFSRRRSNFLTWVRKLKNWSGGERWTKRITNISRHRSKRHASMRLWIPPKCPTLARFSDPLHPGWKPKSAIRSPLDWPVAE